MNREEKRDADRINRDRITGIAAAILSALLYGISPAVAKLAYAGVSNGIMMTFTRSLFGLPVLFLLARRRGVNLKLDRRGRMAVIPVGLFGGRQPDFGSGSRRLGLFCRCFTHGRCRCLHPAQPGRLCNDYGGRLYSFLFERQRYAHGQAGLRLGPACLCFTLL